MNDKFNREFHIFIHKEGTEEQDRILHKLNELNQKLTTMATTLDELLADAQAESNQDDSIIALLQSIKKQLDDILAGNLTPDQQQKVDAIFAQLEANKAKVGDAITANSPPQQPPTS